MHNDMLCKSKNQKYTQKSPQNQNTPQKKPHLNRRHNKTLPPTKNPQKINHKNPTIKLYIIPI